MTGAMVKVPEDQQSQGEEVVVEMYGSFMQTNMAQNKLRSFVSQGNQPPSNMGGGGGGGGSQRPPMGGRM